MEWVTIGLLIVNFCLNVFITSFIIHQTVNNEIYKKRKNKEKLREEELNADIFRVIKGDLDIDTFINKNVFGISDSSQFTSILNTDENLKNTSSFTTWSQIPEIKMTYDEKDDGTDF